MINWIRAEGVNSSKHGWRGTKNKNNDVDEGWQTTYLSKPSFLPTFGHVILKRPVKTKWCYMQCEDDVIMKMQLIFLIFPHLCDIPQNTPCHLVNGLCQLDYFIRISTISSRQVFKDMMVKHTGCHAAFSHTKLSSLLLLLNSTGNQARVVFSDLATPW